VKVTSGQIRVKSDEECNHARVDVPRGWQGGGIQRSVEGQPAGVGVGHVRSGAE
jgi:hypothetical protein